MKTLTTTSWNGKHASRRGLTLTEILASVFVLSFGLLAVLAVLPFGAFQLNRMNVADMSGACGRGALQQIRMAEWQKPENIYISSNTCGNEIVFNSTDYEPADPYFVDPLGCLEEDASNNVRGEIKQFPQSIGSLYAFPLNTEIYNGSGVFLRYDPFDQVLANKYFRWSDDTIFAESDNSSRPTMIQRNGQYVEQASGEFTWVYMVTPKLTPFAQVDRIGFSVNPSGSAMNTVTDFACTPTADRNVTGYEVAAVVFHRRDLVVDSTSPYQPIRKVSLTSSETTINSTGAYIQMESTNAEDLDLTSIKWILLTGQSQEMLDSSGTGGSLVAQWYRVTGYDDIQSGGAGSIRRVFLVGQDWKGAKDGNGNPDGTVYAILCDGVVNVFQATMPK